MSGHPIEYDTHGFPILNPFAAVADRIVDEMIDAWNAELAASLDGIKAVVVMAAVGYRLAVNAKLARLSGAAHELEFYSGER
jgi:hypothetical protein